MGDSMGIEDAFKEQIGERKRQAVENHILEKAIVIYKFMQDSEPFTGTDRSEEVFGYQDGRGLAVTERHLSSKGGHLDQYCIFFQDRKVFHGNVYDDKVANTEDNIFGYNPTGGWRTQFENFYDIARARKSIEERNAAKSKARHDRERENNQLRELNETWGLEEQSVMNNEGLPLRGR